VNARRPVTASRSTPAAAVRLLDAPARADASLVERLTGLINEVYASAERGLWRDGATRTTPSEVAWLIGARQLAVARSGGRLAGAVRVRAISEITGKFGMLAVHPDHRGIGIGRKLVAFAERRGRDVGLQAMQLELLMPRGRWHPNRTFLDAWYRRIGYHVIRTIAVDDMRAGLSMQLATPCAFVVYEKRLDTRPTPRRPSGSLSAGAPGAAPGAIPAPWGR
jgi:GNAT superfamily N-acetyltransferase